MRTVAILLLVGGAAFADKPAPSKAKAEAKVHFVDGDKAFHLGDFKRAIEEYRKSYELFPAPLLLYDLGQAHRKLGEYEKALHAYQQYLETGPSAEQKATVEPLVAELKGLIEQQRKAQSSPPSGTNPPGKEPGTTISPDLRKPTDFSAPVVRKAAIDGPTGEAEPRGSKAPIYAALGVGAAVVIGAVIAGLIVALPQHPAAPATTLGNFGFSQ